MSDGAHHILHRFLPGHPRKITCEVRVGTPIPLPEAVQSESTPTSMRLAQGVTPPSSFARRHVGLFDTGATGTAVTREVREAARLPLVRTAIIETPGGQRECGIYYASLWLPNQIAFPFLPVIEAECAGCDVLIGMDVIGQSYFSIAAVSIPGASFSGVVFRFSPPIEPQSPEETSTTEASGATDE